MVEVERTAVFPEMSAPCVVRRGIGREAAPRTLMRIYNPRKDGNQQGLARKPELQLREKPGKNRTWVE